MGSCYSRQASKKACDYTTVPMDSNKQDIACRQARPTPYARNPSGTPTTFKRRIPVPTKYLSPKQEELQEKCDTLSSNIQDLTIDDVDKPYTIPIKEKTELSQVDSSDNKTSELNRTELRYSGSHSKDLNLGVDPNYNVLSEKKQGLNNNFTTSCDDDTLDSPEKSDSISEGSKSAYTSAVTNISIIPKYIPLMKKSETYDDTINANPSESVSHSIDLSFPVSSKSSTRLPAKYVTHLSNLPRPQVPQFNDRSYSNAQTGIAKHICSRDGFLYLRAKPDASTPQTQFDTQVQHSKATEEPEKYQGKIPKLKPRTKSNAESNESINFDVDSGIGNSLSEKGGTCEDNATLKDFEQTLSHEGSPVFPCNAQTHQASITSGMFKSVSAQSGDTSRKEDGTGSGINQDSGYKSDRKYGIPVLLNRPKPSSEIFAVPKTSEAWSTPKSDVFTVPKSEGFSTSSKADYYSTPKSYLPRRSTDFYTPTSQSSSMWHERRKFFSDLARSSLSPSVSKNVTSVYSKYINKHNSYSSPKLHTQGSSYIPVNLSRSIPSIISKPRYSLQHGSMTPTKISKRYGDPVLSLDNGITSPNSEMENREFLIDDEIADQPGLITFENVEIPDDTLSSLQQSLNELHALQAVKGDLSFDSSCERNGTLLGSLDSSSTSSLGSDDLMLDFEKSSDRRLSEFDVDESGTPTSKDWNRRRGSSASGSSEGKTFSSLTMQEKRIRSLSTPLRPPRQMVVTDGGDGCVRLDASSYRLLCQDINGAKTLLLRLKRVLEEAETLNPFEGSKGMNACYNFLALNDVPKGSPFTSKGGNASVPGDTNILTQENADLRRQVVYLQQQLKERDSTIKLLQQQVNNYTCAASAEEHPKSNAATQTDRPPFQISRQNQTSSDEEEPSSTIVSSKGQDSHEG